LLVNTNTTFKIIITNKHEIPTPDMARRFPHLQDITNEIPPLDQTANIHLLIGRDVPELLIFKGNLGLKTV